MGDTNADVARLMCVARAVCRRRGFPVDDPEYGSAVGWGVFKATQHPEGGMSLMSFASLLAFRECENVRRAHDRDARCDRAGASRGIGAPPVRMIVSLADFEVLSFVAAHGKSAAARMLYGNAGGTAYRHLCKLLDKIALRVRAEPWRLREEWIGGDDYDPHDPNGSSQCSFRSNEGEAPLGTHGVRWRRPKFRDNSGDGNR